MPAVDAYLSLCFLCRIVFLMIMIINCSASTDIITCAVAWCIAGGDVRLAGCAAIPCINA